MSSNVSLIVSEIQGLKAEILSLKSQVSSLQGLISSKPLSAEPAEKPVKSKRVKKEKKERDPDAEPRAPTEWLIFTNRVRALLLANGTDKAETGRPLLGFCSDLKKENAEFSSWQDGDILARYADWTPPVSEPKEKKAKKGSAAASVASGDAELEEGDKPKKSSRGGWDKLSEEEKEIRKAKMKAGREAKKAAKEHAPVSPPASPKPVALPAKSAVPDDYVPEWAAGALSGPSSSKKAGASNAAPDAPKDEFRGVMLNGKRFLVNLATGHAYHREADGSQGDWAGLFSKTPKPHIDDSVPEPGADEEEDELQFDE